MRGEKAGAGVGLWRRLERRLSRESLLPLLCIHPSLHTALEALERGSSFAVAHRQGDWIPEGPKREQRVLPSADDRHPRRCAVDRTQHFVEAPIRRRGHGGVGDMHV